MSSSVSPQWRNGQRFLSNNSSADLSLDTSLAGLHYVKTNNANTSGTDGGSSSSHNDHTSVKLSKNPHYPFSKSLQIRNEKGGRSHNTNVNDLNIAQNSYQQAFIDDNDAETDTVSMNGNSPAHEISDDENEGLLRNFALLSENFHISEDRRQPQQDIDQERHHPRKPLTPLQHERTLPLPQLQKPSNPDDELRRQLGNCVIVAQTMKPVVHCDTQLPSSVANECSDSDNNSCPKSPNATSSCISSLSADESNYHFPAPAFAPSPPNLEMKDSNAHHHCPEAYQVEEEEVGENYHTLHHHHLYAQKSLSHKLSFRRDSSIPHGITILRPMKSMIFSANNSIDRRNSDISMGGDELQNHICKDARSSEVGIQHLTHHHSQNSDVRSLEHKRPPPHHRRNISSFTAPSSLFKIQRYNRAQYSEVNNYASKDSYSYSKSSAFKNYSAMVNQRRLGTNFVPRHGSSMHPSILDKPALTQQRSASSSPLSLNFTTISSSQHGSHKQNNYDNNPGYDRSIGGENSITSASGSSIIVNGRLVNGIKRRRQLVSPVMGGPGAMMDDHSHHRAVSLTGSSVYESAIMRKVSGLETSVSLDSQSVNAPLPFESSRNNLNRSPVTSVDDATMKSSGITYSSMNGITSISSLTSIQGKRRRRRRTKDELKFFVGKLVPRPIKAMTAVLTKTKRYDLERSSSGCLT